MIKTLERLEEDKFKNKIEHLAYLELDKIFEPDILLYEPMTLTSPGGTYKPDFVLTYRDRLIIVEVKSSWNSPGAARTKRSLKEIQQTYEFLGFFIAMLPQKRHQKNKVIYVDEWRYEIVQNATIKKIELEELKESIENV